MCILRSALTNMLVEFNEEQLFLKVGLPKPLIYFRYVDYTFAIFSNEPESKLFFLKLNRLHLSMKFTFEMKRRNVGLHRFYCR